MKKKHKHKQIKNAVILLLSTICIIFSIIYICKGILFPKKYEEIVNKAAKIYNVDPYLIYAVIKQESNFNEKAVSKSKAKGLMQIMDSTAGDVVKKIPSISHKDYDIFDSYTNINIGTKYISDLIKKYDGNVYMALCAYNAGMGNVDSWFEKNNKEYNSIEKVIENIEFSETRTYVYNTIRYYNIYKYIYN